MKKTLLLFLMLPLTLGLTGCHDDGYYGHSRHYSRPAYYGHSYRRVYRDYDYDRPYYRTASYPRSYSRGYYSRGYHRGSYGGGYGRSYRSGPALHVSF